MKKKPLNYVRQLKTSSDQRVKPGFKNWSKRVSEVPKLLIMGKWFEEAGFEPWSYVDIKVTRRRLVIIPSKTPPVKKQRAPVTNVLEEVGL